MQVDNPLRGIVASRANKRCEYCQYPEAVSSAPLEADHIIRQSAKGPTEPENLALACSHCNRYKSKHQIGTDPLTKIDVRLFNSLTDNWRVNFVLNRKSGEIEGQTPIGRATVVVLLMNTEHRIQMRRRLITFKFYEDFKTSFNLLSIFKKLPSLGGFPIYSRF